MSDRNSKRAEDRLLKRIDDAKSRSAVTDAQNAAAAAQQATKAARDAADRVAEARSRDVEAQNAASAEAGRRFTPRFDESPREKALREEDERAVVRAAEREAAEEAAKIVREAAEEAAKVAAEDKPNV